MQRASRSLLRQVFGNIEEGQLVTNPEDRREMIAYIRYENGHSAIRAEQEMRGFQFDPDDYPEIRCHVYIDEERG